MSKGKAQVTPRQLCGSGEVQSISAPYRIVESQIIFEPADRIPPRKWREQEVDVESDEYIHVARADLQHWLDTQGKREPNAQSRKRDIAQQAIKAFWPNGIPPTILNKQIERQVSDWLKKHDHPSVGRDTILRAAGRKGRQGK